MVYTFKAEGKRLAYDPACGYVLPISALQVKMLNAIELPLGPFCPTSLRYELAKFDSEDVEEAYRAIRSWHKDGKILVDDGGTYRLIVDGSYSEAVLRAAIDAASEGQTSTLSWQIVGDDPQLCRSLQAYAEQKKS